MSTDLVVIGGVGFFMDGLADQIETPYGSVKVNLTRLKGKRVVFISRHGEDHLPPHRVNYRALLWAARSSGAARVVSINTVGTMSFHPVGSLFLPNDFVEFTKVRPTTFFEDRAVHVDMSEPYCQELREHLAEAMRSLGFAPFEGVYVCAEGPHLESPAQIRMMRQFGDVVGMTGYPEVVLARELALCYASLCIITNPACGMNDGKPLTVSEITETMDVMQNKVTEVLSWAAQNLPEERGCRCRGALPDAQL
jgi:5'-methylthioadenosine phosphorylase